MTSRDYLFLFLSMCLGFILQYLPLASFMQWFVPEWVLMMFIFWQIQKPELLNFWWVWPLGLLMDVQQGTLLGMHVVSFAVVLYVLQMMHQRIRMFNVAQQGGTIFLLVCAFQMAGYWGLLLVEDSNKPLSLWTPALVSAVVWPWLQLVLSSTQRKLK
jgi:rod shape-determining protein MreD